MNVYEKSQPLLLGSFGEKFLVEGLVYIKLR